MYAQYRTVKLSETDATGVVYFTEVQKYAMEILEDFLHTKSLGVSKIINDKIFLAPVVHVEVDYLSPLVVGDVMRIDMSVDKIGVSSFVLKYEIKKDEADFLAAVVKISQVSIDINTKHSMPIPSLLLSVLKEI